MICPNCKTELHDDAQLCTDCGAVIVSTPPLLQTSKNDAPAEKRSSKGIIALIICIVVFLLIAAAAYIWFYTDIFKSDKPCIQEQLTFTIVEGIEAKDTEKILSAYNEELVGSDINDFDPTDHTEAVLSLCSPYADYAGKEISEYNITVMTYYEYVHRLYDAMRKQYAGDDVLLAALEEDYKYLDVEEHLKLAIVGMYTMTGISLSDLCITTAEITFEDGTEGAYLLILGKTAEGVWNVYSCDLDTYLSNTYAD